MYYYKTFYTDNTYNVLRSKNPVRNNKQVCNTCYAVRPISAFAYWWDEIKTFIKYEIFNK